MGRAPPALRQSLAELDAEARVVLDRQKLPAWIGFYVYPNELSGETADILWRARERMPRGDAVPTIKRHKPQFATIVDDAGKLDPAARYVMRLWMAERRRRLAVQRKDRDGQRAAKGMWRWLRAYPPSLDRGARNIAQENAKRDAKAAAEWQQWQDEADRIKAQNPRLKRLRVAVLVKSNLGSSKHPKTIALRIRLPE